MRTFLTLLLLLGVSSLACADDASNLPNPRPSAGIGAIDRGREQQIDEVVRFLNGKAKQQYASLEAASKDPEVKKLYAAFLTPSLMDLDPRRHGKYVHFEKRKGFNQIPKPVSYSAMNSVGGLDDIDVWFRIGARKDSGRPHGPFVKFDTPAEAENIRRLFQAFKLLADFWLKDGSLAP